MELWDQSEQRDLKEPLPSRGLSLSERAARANIPEALEILSRAGPGHEPPPEDCLDSPES